MVGADRSPDADVVLSLDGRFRATRAPRTVTAVLDLGHLFERRGYGRWEWLAQNWRVASAVRRSDHLLAPSDAVAFGLERYLRVPASRVTVVAASPGPGFRRPGREVVEGLRRELALPPRYFLFVGTRSRRKNLDLLARAWPAVAAELGPDAGLVLAGPGPGRLAAAAHDLGYVPLDRLPALVAGAIAWVNPSFYEGSAVGALEALACGTPALVAGTGALPKAVDGAGLILDPRDPGEWAKALIAVATREDLRARLAVAALKAAAEIRESPPPTEALLAALQGAVAVGT